MSKPFPALHCFPSGASGNLEPWCFFGSSLGGQRCPGTSKEQVGPLMPGPSAAFTPPPLLHWPPHVLGGWAGRIEWSQEATGPKAVALVQQHSQVLPTKVPPFPTFSRDANTEQCTDGEAESEHLSQDLILSQRSGPPEPFRSLFIHLALAHTDLQARTMSY